MPTYFTPGDTAKLLEVKETTLRKYAILLEKYGYTFTRSGANNKRWYTDQDVIAFKKLITHSIAHGVTLETAAKAVMADIKSESVAVTLTAESENKTGPLERYNGDIEKAFLALHDIIAEQNKKIDTLTKMMIEQREYIQNQEKHNEQSLPEPEAAAEKTADQKPSFFRRLFRK